MTHPSKNGNRKKDNEKLKGILKKEKSETSAPKIDSEKKKAIKWDEMNVTATLHPVGKDYGHMSIDEPPTPYERSNPSLSDDQGINPQELNKRLEELERQNPSFSSIYSDTGSDDDGATLNERRRRDLFHKKRKEHYNEFKIAKKKLSEMHDSDDEERL